MPVLKRDDGIQFAIHAYRELLQPVKGSILKAEIESLAQNHGEYVRLFKQLSGQFEAVFSRDPGFLLGEAVWNYFGTPSDLIYLEALPDNYAIMVVVRSGTVYLDTRIPTNNIVDELASLATTNVAYQIYVSGDLPISDIKERGKFTFEPTKVKSFTRLPEPLFNNLPVDSSLQLLPVEYALRAQKIGVRPYGMYFLVALVIIIIAGVWLHMRAPTTPSQQTAAQQPQTNPYQTYISALTTPNPEKQLAEFASIMNLAYNVPGWQATEVTFSGSSYTIALAPLGGSITLLNQWANANHANLNISQQGVQLTLASKLSNRNTPNKIYNATEVMEAIIDRIDQIMPDRSISLGATTNFSVYKTINLTIQLNQVSPDILLLIGRQLADLPVQLNTISINIDQGLLTGNIQLTVLGN